MQAIVVTYAALVMGVLCFALFFWLSVKAQAAKPSEPARQMAEQARGLVPANFGEVTDLVKALATLSDSLLKAGPTLTALIGAILFLAIAAGASYVAPHQPPSQAVGNNTAPAGQPGK